MKIEALTASRQVRFHQLLVAARKSVLADALSEVLSSIDPRDLKLQLADLVPPDVQRILASAGIRDEYVFPTPMILERRPTLLGYYRLLLGTSQKTFYSSSTGRGRFKTMEERGTLSAAQRVGIRELCGVFSDALADLVRQMSPAITRRDVDELPLLALGSQFQGGNNVVLGRKAVEALYVSILEIVKPYVSHTDKSKIVITNSSGRTVTIVFGADPDIRIHEETEPKQVHYKVAVEVKGGTDRSNAHNRAGEAEKSHQNAKAEGFGQFWTVIAKKGLNMERLKSESPTTNQWFDVSEVLGRQGDDWLRFHRELAVTVGIPFQR